MTAIMLFFLYAFFSMRLCSFLYCGWWDSDKAGGWNRGLLTKGGGRDEGDGEFHAQAQTMMESGSLGTAQEVICGDVEENAVKELWRCYFSCKYFLDLIE